jgi:hypothetical protein
MINVQRILTVPVACLAVFGGASVMAANGIQNDEFDASDELYVDCLGEVIEYEEHIDIRFHEFETPSGNYHLVDRWTFTLTATGMTTGRMWFGVLQSPGELNSGPSEVFQYAIRGVIRGIGNDTPNFAWTGSYKSTVNANGELVVENDSGGFLARCLGNN